MSCGAITSTHTAHARTNAAAAAAPTRTAASAAYSSAAAAAAAAAEAPTYTVASAAPIACTVTNVSTYSTHSSRLRVHVDDVARRQHLVHRPRIRGLHSFTFRLNISAFYVIGGAFRGCIGGV